MDFKFLNKVENSIYFKSPNGKLEIYIPKLYLDADMELAVEYGLEIETIGMFLFKYYPDKDKTKFNTFQFELTENITFSYSEVYETKDVLIKNSEEDDYKVFVLYDGDMFIKNTEIVQTFLNTEKFVKLHFAGKLPSHIKYSNILNLYIESMQTNKCDLGCPASLLESMIGELARDPANLSNAFRKVVEKKKLSELDYKQISIKNLALINSTFTAFTSENTKNILTYSIERKRNGGKEIESPIEKSVNY